MMGTTMISAGTGSRKMPSAKKKPISSSIAHCGSAVIDSTSCSAACPAPARLSTQLNNPAPASVTSALPVMKAADEKLRYSEPAVCRRPNSPNSSAYSAATAPASVGVNTPDRMPPMMMIGITSAGTALDTALPRSPQSAGGVGAAPTRGARNHTSVSIARPAIAPGTTPPRKRSPIDTPVTEP